MTLINNVLDISAVQILTEVEKQLDYLRCKEML